MARVVLRHGGLELAVKFLIGTRGCGMILRGGVGCDQGIPKENTQYYAPEPTLRGHSVLMVAPRVERTAIKPMPSNRRRSRGSAFDVYRIALRNRVSERTESHANRKARRESTQFRRR